MGEPMHALTVRALTGPWTITRSGAVLPVKVRTARTRHICDDCGQPIESGEHYELSVTPPHRIAEYDVPCWLTWRSHYPRHDGGRFLIGCDLAAAYREKAVRAQLGAQSEASTEEEPCP